MRLRTLVIALTATMGLTLLGATPALAQEGLCPSDNPVIQENNCSGAGSGNWRLTNFNDNVAGFATKTSVNRGENVALKIGRASAAAPSSVNIDVYRLGYYDNQGGRLLAGASHANVAVNNLFSGCSATDTVTGKKSCASWATSYTIPGASLPATGEYVAKITDPVGGGENSIFFTVRDDNRAPKADILFAVPTASYEAYNDWGGKSLYGDTLGGPATVSGDGRAVKVSFDRPLADPRRNNTFFGPDFYLVQWLEKQGYDVAYTDDVSLHQNPTQLLGHKIDLVSGHSEYWSLEQFNGYLSARDAGVNLASFSANTSFWKVRYEDGARTLVCYKTAQGTGSEGSGADGENDWGPDGVKGTSDDALGLDQIAGTADDRPQNSSTTFRDNGASNGDPNAPDGGRVGPNMPENMLWGNMYYGAELAAGAFPLTIPAADAQSQFSGDRIWRNTGISTSGSTTIGTNIVGWEWDAIPTQAQYLAKQPAGVKRLTNTTFATNNNILWLQDEGRAYATTAPPGQPAASQAVKYTAASGALVFAAGTNDWANALVINPDARMIQATYNILSDEGVQPGNPSGVTLDPPSGPQPPTASFTVAPNPAQTGQQVTFDGTSSTDLDGPIAKYEWDLDGDGSYEVDSGTNPVTTKTYSASGVITVRLRVTDGQGVRSTTNRALSIDNTGGGSYPSRVLGTTGLTNYWRMGDTTGTTLVDSFGSANATTVGTPSLGTAGALSSDADTAVNFDGTNDAASAQLGLAGTNKLTVEFWMKWNGYADDDRLAMEFTPNFNSTAGGFIIDPNAPQGGGKFAVSIGDVSTRNNVIFDRPSAGKWHHYAFVFDTSAAAASQILPYVDGQPIAYTKLASNTGAGNFANSTLYFMSRAASGLFGRGDLDEVAIFNRALPATTIAAHYAGNPQAPTASVTASADPAAVGQLVTFDGSGSTSPTGTITKYEWDLDGNGTFETNTGTTPSATKTYASAGPVDVKLRVTDSATRTATATVSITVEQTTSGTYTDRVRNTAGLTHYWRFGELTGSTLADSKGSSNATITGGPVLGAPGAVAGDSDTSVRFNGTTAAASAPVDLSATSKLTVEFWLKWNQNANDDDLAMEFTSNFNANTGGFLIDPNESGGKFAVSIGDAGSRNNVVFDRPSAGQWHHYAFVVDTTAVAASQIIPYVDGQPIAYTKLASNTGASNFANSTLYFMSRAASGLFGAGDLDEVAIYNRALSAATIAGHYGGNAQPPTASFTADPNPAQLGQTVTFNGSASSDPDGSITKYEWDLDGNGSYETDTGTTATTTRVYSAGANIDVKLRVTDNAGNTDTVTHTLTIEAPSSGAYPSRVLGTAGLTNYWRMGEASGTTLGDTRGTSPATLSGTPTLGATGALAADTDTATSFSGSGDAASANLNLSGTSKLTVEFWMKWDAYADDDRLAMEFTPNFNQNAGGFLIDPNASGTGGKFAVSLGHGDGRNNVVFDRPSAGQWHHYAFVFDTTAPAASQILPYVDGDPIAFTKLASGTGEGAFASSQLFFMSRAASGLFGAGDLDEVAIYNRALSATTISDHYGGVGGGSGQAPTAAFTSSPSSPQTGDTVTFNGSTSSDPDGSIAKYEWDLDGNGSYETDTGTTATTTKSYATVGSVDVRLRVTDNSGTRDSVTHTVTIANRSPTASFTVTPNPATVGQSVAFNASASSDADGSIAKYEWDLDGNGSYETDTGTTATAAKTYTAQTSVDVKVRVTDDRGATATQTKTLTFQNAAPTAAFTATPNPVVSGATATFDASTSTDADGTIVKYEWDLDGNGSYETNTGTTKTTTRSYATPGTVTVGLRVTDSGGATGTKTVTVTVANRAPAASFTVTPSPAATRQTVTLNGAGSTDPDGTIAKYEWDLDGNGTYEIDGGTTATRTLSYAATGTFTLGLRVTDSSGATATTTRSLTVSSAYRTAVLGTAGISDYWRLDDTGTTAVDSNGANNNGSYVNGTTSVTGLIAGETNNNARAFDGGNDYVDLSPTPFGSPSQFSAETWVRTAATKSSGGWHFLITDSSAELSGSSLSLSDGFAVAIDSANRVVFQVARNSFFSTTRATATTAVALAPNTIHHVAVTYDGATIRIYVDGVQAATASFSGGLTWSGSRDLRLGRPNESSAASFLLNGTLDETALYTQALPAATVLAHYNAGH